MMNEGEVVAIYLRTKRGEPLAKAQAATAIAGRGLEGDHGLADEGETIDPGHELTLIETEAIDALMDESGVTIEPWEPRRNIVTRGVALNHLVGREFTAGGLRLRGMRLCEPCGHLRELTSPEVYEGLIHRGGLRAQILEGGKIKVGDRVAEVT